MNRVSHAFRVARRYADGGSAGDSYDPALDPAEDEAKAFADRAPVAVTPPPTTADRARAAAASLSAARHGTPPSPVPDTAPPGEQSLTQYNPTMKERLLNTLSDSLAGQSLPKQNFVEGIGHIMDWVPGVGQALQAQEGIQRGDYQTAAAAFIPGAAEGFGGWGKAVEKQAAAKVAEELAAGSAYKTKAGTGSQPGGFFSGFSDGQDRYIKWMDEAHAKNEVLANRFYEMWGVPVAHNELTTMPNGQSAVASHIIPNARHLNEVPEDTYPWVNHLHDHFPADAMLANWDVVGLNRDNVLVGQDGQAYRIDHGGALKYRAQGQPKGYKFGNQVGELDTMRQQGEAGQVFKDVQLDSNNPTAQKIAATSNEQIFDTITGVMGENDAAHDLAMQMIARRDDLAKRYGLDPNEFQEDLTGGGEHPPGAFPRSPRPRDTETYHPQNDDSGKPVLIKEPNIPGPIHPSGYSFIPGQEVAGINISGKPFTDWKPPGKGFWSKIKDEPLDEPAIPSGNFSTGIIMEEPDGRIWISHPTNQFGGYQATFPKGRMEFGFSPQQNAIKETYEETGLRADITGLLGDFKKTTGTTRYYIGQRALGSPSNMGWESQGMSVLSPEDAKEYLNMAPDHKIIDAYMQLKAKQKPEATDINQLTEAPGWLKSGQGYPDQISEEDWKSLQHEADRYVPAPAQYDTQTGLPTSMPEPPKIEAEDKPSGPPLKLMQLNKTHSPDQIVKSIAQISKADAESNPKLITPKQTIKIQQLVDGLSPAALASNMLGMPYKQQVNVKSWMSNTDKYVQVNHALETLAEGKSKYTAKDIQEHEENKHQHELYDYEMSQGIPSGDQQSTWGKKPTTKTVVNPKTGKSTEQKGAEIMGQFVPQHIFDAIKPYNYATHTPINKGKILTKSDFPNANYEDVKKNYHPLQLWHSGETGEHGHGSYINEWSNPLTYSGYTYKNEKGIFASESKGFSGSFGGGNVLPYVVRKDAKTAVVHFPEAKYPDSPYKDSASYSGTTVAQLNKAARSMGYDMLIIKNMNDGHMGMAQYVILNPSILKAPKAQFKQLKSMKPLSGIAGIPAAGAATYGISQQGQEQPQYYRGGGVKGAMRVVRGLCH